MSGDDRDRLPPHKRLRFDEACDRAADAILALVLPAIQAARVEALREAEQIAYQHRWREVPENAYTYEMGCDNAARSIGASIAALIEKELAS